MRKDMSKIIVERPRLYGSKPRPGRSQDPENMLSKEGMRKPYVRQHVEKQLNENLAPLLRFLNSRVGKFWNDVYSEISENLRADNPVQQHVRDHLEDFVEIHTLMRDGEIHITSYGVRLLEHTSRRFYVHPETHRLEVNPHHRAWTNRWRTHEQEQKAARLAHQRTLPDGTQLRKKDGIWYVVEVKPIPPVIKVDRVNSITGKVYQSTQGGTAYDVILEATVSRSGENSTYNLTTRTHAWGAPVYCATKRQLNHRELKKYGVAND